MRKDYIKFIKLVDHLNFSLKYGHLELVKLLFEDGLDIHAKDEYGYTLLHLAAWKGHKEITELLIEKGSDVNDKNKYGSSALHLAAENGDLKLVELLLDSEADVNVRDYDEGNTPLHLAAFRGHKSVTILLIGVSATCLQKGTLSKFKSYKPCI